MVDTIDFTKISDAHRALLSGVQRNRAKPKPLLADQIQNPTAWLKDPDGVRRQTDLMTSIRKYEKVVLDDEAAALVANTANTEPKQVARMCELAISPYDKLWVEMSYAVLDRIVREHTGTLSTRPTHDDERIAFVYENRPNAVILRIVQHKEGDPAHLHEWPIAYIVSNSGKPIESEMLENFDGEKMVGQDVDGLIKLAARQKRGDLLQQTGRVWGYTPGMPGLKKLAGLSEILILPRNMTAVPPGVNPYELSQYCAKELTGLVRRAVAVLALMNTTIVQIGERTRPPGRFMAPGGSKAFLERTTAVLNIPHRIRYIDQYVQKQIRDEVDRIRKRRHHVKGHFRHLPYEPINGTGWVPCFCPGRPAGRFWHKHVHDHWRGDESLGIIEHDYTIVRGGGDDE